MRQRREEEWSEEGRRAFPWDSGDRREGNLNGTEMGCHRRETRGGASRERVRARRGGLGEPAGNWFPGESQRATNDWRFPGRVAVLEFERREQPASKREPEGRRVKWVVPVRWATTGGELDSVVPIPEA